MTKSEPVTKGQVSARAPDGSLLTGNGIGIAIVDTGIDGTHPDLVYGDVVKRNLKFFYTHHEAMADTDTSSGHGTVVAGVAAGRGYLPEYEGLAPGATLYGLGVGEAMSVFWALQAFDWILGNHDKVDPPIKVVVNSWGSTHRGHEPSSPTAHYIDALVDRGLTVVFAAGNSGGDGSKDMTSSECDHPREGVVCVGAYRDGGRSTRDGDTAGFSSRGDRSRAATWPDLVAPGDLVTAPLALTGTMAATGAWQESPSTLYTTLSGTSMAAPMVGAAAAILYQLDPNIRPADVERALEQGAFSFDGSGRESVSSDARYAGSTFDRGHGLLDVQNGVDTWLRLRSMTSTTEPSSGGGGGSGGSGGSGGTFPNPDHGGVVEDTTGEDGLVDDTVDTLEGAVETTTGLLGWVR